MPVVIYPPQLKTNKEKLFACYSLLEQLRLEYNKVSAIAASDTPKYESKFRSYADKAKSYLEQLLAERNALMESIRWANYSPTQWQNVSELGQEEQRTIYQALFGSRQIEKIKTTTATSPLLDDLKTTSLDNMPLKLGDDPTEDFTTYTEVDPSSNITKDANTIDFASCRPRYDTFYVYKDKTADHFSGDFEHRVKWRVTSFGSSYGDVMFWALSNTPDKDNYTHRVTPFYSYLGAKFYRYGSSEYGCTLDEQDSSSFYYDYYTNYSVGTTYYATLKRDEGVGTYGTLYYYLCTGNYYGEAGSSLVDTMSITLHTSKKDFRYIYVLQSFDDNLGSGYTATGWVEDLDLREWVAVTPSPVSAIASVANPAVVQSSISVTPSAASAIAKTANPAVVQSSMAVTPSPVSAIAGVIAPVVVKGSTTIVPAAASAIASVVAPTAFILGSATVAPAAASAIASVVNPISITTLVTTSSAVYGLAGYGYAVYGFVGEEAVVVIPSPAQARASVAAPTVVKGSTSITPTASSALAKGVQPTVKLGNTSVIPSTASAIASVVNPTALTGAVIPSPISAIASTVNPTLVLTSISITPSSIGAVASVVDPIVSIESPLYITPEAAGAVAATESPAVVLSAMVVIPSPASSLASIIAPTVRLGSIYFVPAAISAIAKVAAPTVIQASITIAPASVRAIASRQNPSVVLGSMTITPAFVKALAAVISPTVLQSWVGKKMQVEIVTTTARQVGITTTQKRNVTIATVGG